MLFLLFEESSQSEVFDKKISLTGDVIAMSFVFPS
jgi:hypothetical protein